MVAPLDDPAVVQHHYGVGVADGGEPMGDDEHRPPLHQLIHAPLHQSFGTGVDGGGSLVQNQHRRVGDGGPGNSQKLALALAELLAVVGEDGLITHGQPGNELVGVGQLGGGDDVFIGGVQTAVADVLPDGASKQVGILEHHAQAAAEVLETNLVDVYVVVSDLPSAMV